MGNFSLNNTKIGGYLHENLETPIPYSGNLLQKIKLWLDWALFLTCTLLQEGFPTNIDLTYPQFMLGETDCSCATRFRHGMVGGGILDQRQILGQFARNSQCAKFRYGLVCIDFIDVCLKCRIFYCAGRRLQTCFPHCFFLANWPSICL